MDGGRSRDAETDDQHIQLRQSAGTDGLLLKDKSSPYALHWDDDESMLLSVARLVTIIESDAPANTLRQEASNWRHWLAFCEQYRTSPWRKPLSRMTADEADAENIIWAKALLFIA